VALKTCIGLHVIPNTRPAILLAIGYLFYFVLFNFTSFPFSVIDDLDFS
jgi:hypothetical protein